MSQGTNILFNISLFKLSELAPSWVLNVTEILESLIHKENTTQNSLWCCLEPNLKKDSLCNFLKLMKMSSKSDTQLFQSPVTV